MELHKWLIFLAVFIAYYKKSVVDALACDNGEMVCGNGACVSLSWKCDGEDDCGDNSDEKSCAAKKCQADKFQCKNGRCILKIWTCDKSDDCGDNSDESKTDGPMCAAPSCSGDEFQCNVTKACIRKSFVCDGRPDCGLSDNSDEIGCSAKEETCSKGELKCGDGNCVSLSWKCDGDEDCSDGSDEKECAAKKCQADKFQCKNGRCILKIWTCDKSDDCGDNSDESKTDGPMCAAPSCSGDEFQCNVTKACIRKSFVCDGHPDCGLSDNSDEVGCSAKEETCSKGELKCGDGNCVSLSWKCDGDEDCSDGSDEKECGHQKCPSDDQFMCVSDGRCISKNWTCDGRNDCSDNSDESATSGPFCRPQKCQAHEFQCKSGNCINSKFKCDGTAECSDRSDETNCKLSACGADEFKCVESGRCIKKKYRCDVSRDCLDGSDEMNCQTTTAASTTQMKTTTLKQSTLKTTPKACLYNSFRCKVDEKCIHNSWLCDGEADCKDGEDESNAVCDQRTCSPSQFACKNGKCIAKNQKCDGTNDCGDNSDEAECTLKQACTSATFSCPSNKTICIDQSLVCDGKKDCPNGGDEPNSCGTNECALSNHGCSHNCVDLKIGYKCTCRTGYYLSSNNKTCLNVNECEKPGLCSQSCVDLKGSYKCFCSTGYKLDGDLHHCRADGPVPVLIFSNRADIRQIQTDGKHYKPVVHTQHIRSAISLDIDTQGKVVYWADNINKTLARASLSNADKVETIVTNVDKPEGVAYDWIGKKVYWSNTHPKYQSCIEVADASGSNRLVLAHKKIDQPRAVAVHPLKRFVFWSDWGTIPKIERMSMDGLQRSVVVSSENLGWPNGLAIDFASDRLFWADGKKSCIGSANLDGSKMAIVATGIEHPFGLTVFEDYVYWTNYRGRQVFRANKFTGKEKYEFQDGFFSPMDIQVYHPVAQKRGPNPCALNNGGCTHLCLLSAVSSSQYSCACPTDIKLLPDGKTCDVVLPETQAPVVITTRPVSKVLSTAIPSTNSEATRSKTEFPFKTDKPVTTLILSTSTAATTSSDAAIKPTYNSQGCLKNQFMCSSSRECIDESNVCDGVDDCPNKEDELLPKCNSVLFDATKSKAKTEDSDKSPLIAGVIAGIAFVVLVIVIVLLIVYKRRRSEANLSITFQQADQELISVQTVKFNANGTHKWPSKDFENINYTDVGEREELIKDPGLMNVPDDSSSDSGSTCDETKPVMQHQQSTSSNSVVM